MAAVADRSRFTLVIVPSTYLHHPRLASPTTNNPSANIPPRQTD